MPEEEEEEERRRITTIDRAEGAEIAGTRYMIMP